MEKIKIAFHQQGARRNYALPLVLYQQGLLQNLFTDFYAYSWMIEWARATEKLSNGKISITGNLCKRRQNGLPDDKVYSLDWLFLFSNFPKKNLSYQESYLLNQKISFFIAQLIKNEKEVISHIYCYSFSAKNCREVAKTKILIVDQIHTPIKSFLPILTEEMKIHSDWSNEISLLSGMEELYLPKEQEDKESIDFFFAPSDSVKESLINDLCIDEEKVYLNPYPAPFWLYNYNTTFKENSTRIMRSSTSGDKLRILFVGNVDLRKGVPYLLQALRKLNPHKFTARIVGSIGINESKVKEYSDIVTFMGKLDKQELAKQYEWADVFVFPSLSEGSAGVIYEAMAFGLAVITTKSSGSWVTHGIEGLIIEERNIEQIVESLLMYMENPNLVDLHGQNSWQKIKSFNIEETGIRLKNLFSLIS
ncbi:exopolysaccharide biosynthesis glycosyltransferase EpsF [Geminocystis sp. NIES-3708]|uniref:glycosyltransferase family 4 protein n=1 Tax=Geminocystis sp. NIES-3708 TaxID=1615909 RepID=UPI0005FCAB67|nr:glycosyltransferase family 4 protein [Geminocystis sp. NIES-3708]BAQ61193.1 exopolysaccharide biosynthesis glycosyltransferase EpsF [Geminocystis sp. NIES-3708]